MDEGSFLSVYLFILEPPEAKWGGGFEGQTHFPSVVQSAEHEARRHLPFCARGKYCRKDWLERVEETYDCNV